MSKKRPPMEQLLAAGRQARQMLRDKGIEAQESVLDVIMKTEGAPMLPGIPVYLPHQWTLKASQRLLRDVMTLWKEECEDDEDRMDDLKEFWIFLIAILRDQEADFAKDEAAMPELIKSLKDVPVLKDIFGPTRKREAVFAIQRFFVDGFAVSLVLKGNLTTTEYANWFLDWTQDLYSLWVNPQFRERMNRV
jgi:hypothetical protein